jgi:hypothetical protein
MQHTGANMTTVGEYRVGISFNPSANPHVDAIKRIAADFIDMLLDPIASADESALESQLDKFYRACQDIDLEDIPERRRLLAIALDFIDGYASANSPPVSIEDAAMWAVKAATKPKWDGIA